jgi:predicted RNA-binding protein YlqC (UPF0109 family)
MKQLIVDIAKALVDIPEEVAVREVEGEQVTILELRVAASDLGKVIGKQGRTARSIRTILGAAGMTESSVYLGNPRVTMQTRMGRGRPARQDSRQTGRSDGGGSEPSERSFPRRPWQSPRGREMRNRIHLGGTGSCGFAHVGLPKRTVCGYSHRRLADRCSNNLLDN